MPALLSDFPKHGHGKIAQRSDERGHGNWIACIDADDATMLPASAASLFSSAGKSRGLVVASSLVYYINEKGRTIGQILPRNSPVSADITEAVKNHMPIGFITSATIFRKDVIQLLGGYRSQFWPADDMTF